MKIKITGSTGYLGNIITRELTEKGLSVSGINRRLLYGSPEKLEETLKNTGALINLAGSPVLQRWTKKNKKLIYESRVLTTQNLVKAINNLPQDQRPKKVISASAIGIYANDVVHSEESHDFDTGFLGEVVKEWEASWNQLPGNVHLTIFRIGVVLGKESATIKKLLLPFKLGIVGKIGNGKQPFPFVHETDVARAFAWAVENVKTAGIYNLTAPQQITNNDFTSALAEKLKRPAFIPVPAFVLKVAFGKAAGMLTQSPAVLTQALSQKGFEFRYATIEKALKEIFGNKHVAC